MSNGAFTQSARCSMRSNIGSSAQWMSSKKRMSGCTSPNVCMTSRAAHEISCGLRSPSTASRRPDGQADEVGNGIVLAARAELLERLFERLVVGDSDRRLDHLRERPVRDAFAVGQAAALEHACAVHRVDELAGQPALADTRLSVDREEVGTAVTHRSLVRVLEQLQLGLAADERSADVDVGAVDRR